MKSGGGFEYRNLQLVRMVGIGKVAIVQTSSIHPDGLDNTLSQNTQVFKITIYDQAGASLNTVRSAV